MFLFGFKFSGLVPFVFVDLEGSDVLSDVVGCSLVTVISRLFGNDAIILVVPGNLEYNWLLLSESPMSKCHG